MKKIIVLFIMSFLLIWTFGIISAKENVVLEIPQAGSIGALERIAENFRLSLIGNPERKTEKSMILAEERLAEIKKLIEEGNFERAERLKKHYERLIQKSERATERIESGEDLGMSENALRKIARVENYVERHNEILEEIHARILENNPYLTEEEIKKIDLIFERAYEKSTGLEIKVLERFEKFETQHKNLSEMTDEEILELRKKIESEEGILEERNKRVERFKERSMRAIQSREANLEKARLRIENSNMSDEEREKAINRLEMREAKFEEFKARKEQMNHLKEQKKEETKLRQEEKYENKETRKKERMNDSEVDSRLREKINKSNTPGIDSRLREMENVSEKFNDF